MSSEQCRNDFRSGQPVCLWFRGVMVVLSFLPLVFLASPVPAAGHDSTGPSPAPSGGDQFAVAVMELVATAAREGKEVVIRRAHYGGEGSGPVLMPRNGKISSTVVLSVEIKENGRSQSLSTSLLLDNQEQIIRGLNAICVDQLAAGNRIGKLLEQGNEMELGMRDMTSGVDGVATGVAETSSEVGGVTSISMSNARTLGKINAQLQTLNQLVDALASSMGEVSDKIGDLARAGDPWDNEDESKECDHPDRTELDDREETSGISGECAGGGVSVNISDHIEAEETEAEDGGEE